MDIETKLNEFKPIKGFMCPAEFWPALGCDSQARYVGIRWDRYGDEVAWGDGRADVVGVDWPAYLKLIEANFPLGHPARWLLGDSETSAAMWLIIDRVTEWAWLVPAYEAWDVLQMQYPAAELPPPAMTVDELLAALDAAVAQLGNGRAAVDLDFDQVMARQAELDAAFEAALRGRVARVAAR